MNFVINPFTGKFDCVALGENAEIKIREMRKALAYSLSMVWYYNAIIGINSDKTYMHDRTNFLIKNNDKIIYSDFMIIRNNYISFPENIEELNIQLFRNGQLLNNKVDYFLSSKNEREENYSDDFMKAFGFEGEDYNHFKYIICELIISLSEEHKMADLKEFKLLYSM